MFLLHYDGCLNVLPPCLHCREMGVLGTNATGTSSSSSSPPLSRLSKDRQKEAPSDRQNFGLLSLSLFLCLSVGFNVSLDATVHGPLRKIIDSIHAIDSHVDRFAKHTAALLSWSRGWRKRALVTRPILWLISLAPLLSSSGFASARRVPQSGLPHSRSSFSNRSFSCSSRTGSCAIRLTLFSELPLQPRNGCTVSPGDSSPIGSAFWKVSLAEHQTDPFQFLLFALFDAYLLKGVPVAEYLQDDRSQGKHSLRRLGHYPRPRCAPGGRSNTGTAVTVVRQWCVGHWITHRSKSKAHPKMCLCHRYEIGEEVPDQHPHMYQTPPGNPPCGSRIAWDLPPPKKPGACHWVNLESMLDFSVLHQQWGCCLVHD